MSPYFETIYSYWWFNTIGSEIADIIFLTGRFWRQKRGLGKTQQ